MSYYDINGTRFSLTSADIDIGGLRLIGATGLKLTEKLEPGEVPGNSSVARGYTKGKWSGTGAFKLPFAEAMILKRTLGQAYGTRILRGTWNFVELDGDGFESVQINGARITSTDFDGGESQTPSTVSFELLLTQPCSWNGVSIVDMPDQSGVGLVLSLFGM